jgi:hypothetical protein
MDQGELRRRLALASAFKEGDLAVGGTADDRLREDARRLLLATHSALSSKPYWSTTASALHCIGRAIAGSTRSSPHTP